MSDRGDRERDEMDDRWIKIAQLLKPFLDFIFQSWLNTLREGHGAYAGMLLLETFKPNSMTVQQYFTC